MAKKSVLALILLVILFGSALRFFRIGKESFWQDEMISVRVARAKDCAELFQNLHRFTRFWPPSHLFILQPWMRLVGADEGPVRGLSALFGILTIPLLFFLGRDMFDARVGLLSAFFFAINPLNIRFAQEARVYTLVALLTTASFLFFYRLSRKTSLWNVLGYIATTSVLLQTHLLAPLIPISQFVVFLLTMKTFRTRRLFLILMFAGLMLVWLPVPLATYPHVKAVFSEPGHAYLAFGRESPVRVGLLNVFGIMKEFAGGSSLVTLLVLAVLPLASISTVNGMRRWHWRDPILSVEGRTLRIESLVETTFLWVWLLLPIAVIYAVSKAGPLLIGNVRYALMLSPAFFLLLSKALSGRRLLAFLSVALILVSSSVNLWTFYTKPQKPEWREAAQFFTAGGRSGDSVLVRRWNILEAERYLPQTLEVKTYADPHDLSNKITEALAMNEHVWVFVLCEPEDLTHWTSALDLRDVVARPVEGFQRIHLFELKGSP